MSYRSRRAMMQATKSCIRSLHPSGQATTGTSICRPAIVDPVVGDEKLAQIAVERLERHPGWREEVLANEYKAPRREWVQTA